MKLNLTLMVAVFFASTSAIWIRLAEADSAVIALMRAVFAFLLFLPPVIRGMRRRQMSLRQWAWTLLAGVVFGLHIAVWIAGVQKTTVANAAICFSVNPVITAAFSHFFLKEKADRWLLLSIGLGILGTAWMGAADLSVSPQYFIGDLLSLASGAVFSFYLLIGKKVRSGDAGPPAGYYMGVLYLGAAIAMAILVLVKGAPVTGLSPTTWGALLGLTICPTILGHGLFNWLLRYLRASVVSTATLGEPLFAGLMAWLFYGESLSAVSGIGYGFIAASVWTLMRSMDRMRA